ncbi:MAG: polysaccharide biosynthesis/export family protein [Bacteroidales bacterium]|jgi:polysaccharide export outer membrane protein|nr:polysaccharide biosynthesis/export family protein [Bacteroidales bacterium]
MNCKIIILLCLVLASCHSEKKIAYMQDVANEAVRTIEVNAGIVIQAKDVLSIVVSSKNPELVMAFNLPLLTYQAGSTQSASSYSQRLLGYTVDLEGNIDFPVLGKLKVAGLTRDQLSEMIKQRLIQENLIKDPIIVTDFMNFKIYVLGEVKTPGAFALDGDRITILEALGKAGDLTIYGKRDNVLVRREKDGVVNLYRVDLRSEALLRSPVYYLQQNDVVYVEPNKTRAGQSRINENRSMGVWISLASLLTSMAVLIFK